MSVTTSLFFASTQSLKIWAAPDFVAPCAAPHTQLVQLGQGLVGGGTEVLVLGRGGVLLGGVLLLLCDLGGGVLVLLCDLGGVLLLQPEAGVAGRLGVRGPGLLFSQSVGVDVDQPLSLRRRSWYRSYDLSLDLLRLWSL